MCVCVCVCVCVSHMQTLAATAGHPLLAQVMELMIQSAQGGIMSTDIYKMQHHSGQGVCVYLCVCASLLACVFVPVAVRLCGVSAPGSTCVCVVFSNPCSHSMCVCVYVCVCVCHTGVLTQAVSRALGMGDGQITARHILDQVCVHTHTHTHTHGAEQLPAISHV